MTLQVLVVEDEPVASAAHAAYVGRVPGFAVAAQVSTGLDALRILTAGGVDLVLLDMHLPDAHGLEIVRVMRAKGVATDVIAVTSARDLDVVRAAVSLGVVQYLLKPFVFASLRERLEAYADYHRRTSGPTSLTTQGDVDQVFAELRTGGSTGLPKGLSEDLWGGVLGTVRAAGAGVSAGEMAGTLGVARVTARRYLEHLAESGLATRHSRHSGAGRPEVEYRWAGR